jgi:transposase
VVLVAADENTAVAVEVVPSTVNEITRADRLVAAAQARAPVAEAVGDKGFDSNRLRDQLLARGVRPVIPNRRGRPDPRPFDPAPYRERNKVERLFAKAKQYRRFATRYDKLRVCYLGVTHLVLGFIRLRSSVNTA